MRGNFSKQDLLDALLQTVQLTRDGADVEKLELISRREDGDTVVIHYLGGGIKVINIEADSGMAIIRDVCRAIS